MKPTPKSPAPTRNRAQRLPSQAELLQLEAEQGRNDLFYFAKHILGYNLLREDTHQTLCDILSFRHRRYPRKRKLVLLPRDTFKSTIGTVALPLHLLTRQPNLSVLIDCEVFGTAKGFLSEIKARLEEPGFQSRYGNWIPGRADSHRWTENLIEIMPRTRRAKEGSIACSGVDKSITGHHYDVVVCDDLVGETNYATAEQLEKVWKHFNLVSEAILKRSGILIVIGTRWHDSDVYGKILELTSTPEAREDWDIIVRPAAHQADDPSKAEWPPTPTTKYFFPQRLDEATLRKKWEAMDDELFFSQYILDPTPKGSAAFSSEWFQYYNELPKTPLNFHITTDPSTATKHGDFSATVVVAVDQYSRWYVETVIRERMDPSELIELWFTLNDQFHPMSIGVETVSFQQTLMHFLQEEQIKRNKWLPIVKLKTSTNITKEQRIRSLVPYFKQRQVYFKHPPTTGHNILIHELTRFPKAAHDDAPDALAYIPQLLIKPDPDRPPPPPEDFTSRMWDALERESRMAERKFPTGDPPWMT